MDRAFLFVERSNESRGTWVEARGYLTRRWQRLFTLRPALQRAIVAASPADSMPQFLERAMGQNQKQPSKHQVRHYMEGRQSEHKPPPSQKEIRRQLGLELIEQERED